MNAPFRTLDTYSFLSIIFLLLRIFVVRARPTPLTPHLLYPKKIRKKKEEKGRKV